ncbi:protein of unknown function [Rhodovastum atsumiense]|nr:hypothetical protein [Rhodovastum atsumiense]KAA5609018.1 hypothetical protein F1189_26415 [Rhodovastum atsumiense]CAH2599063.1 protein of unknown function [Rhodovastum atsumiense]
MRDSLHAVREDLAERGSLRQGPVRRTSLVLEAQVNPLATAARSLGEATLAAGAASLRRLLRAR